MSAASSFPLIAVDIGNSRVKCGRFDEVPAGDSRELPLPVQAVDLIPGTDPWNKLDALCGDRDPADFSWWIGSVQRQTTSQLVDHLKQWDVGRITLVSSRDLPLEIALARPDMVGIDRLLGAVAANRLRTPGRPAVVCHLGTAITVNLVAADGKFLGGAILPGITMSARALHEFTDLLPLIDMHSLKEPPPAVGEATLAAMTSGLYWGAVGGVKQLIELFARQVGGEPDVFLTGGAAPSVAQLLPGHAVYERHLVLGGIALAAAAAK